MVNCAHSNEGLRFSQLYNTTISDIMLNEPFIGACNTFWMQYHHAPNSSCIWYKSEEFKSAFIHSGIVLEISGIATAQNSRSIQSAYMLMLNTPIQRLLVDICQLWASVTQRPHIHIEIYSHSHSHTTNPSNSPTFRLRIFCLGIFVCRGVL